MDFEDFREFPWIASKQRFTVSFTVSGDFMKITSKVNVGENIKIRYKRWVRFYIEGESINQ